MISSRDSKQFVTRNFVFRTSFFPDPVLSILLHRDTTCKLRKRAANYFSTTIGIILHHYYYPLLVPTIEKYRSIEIILPQNFTSHEYYTSSEHHPFKFFQLTSKRTTFMDDNFYFSYSTNLSLPTRNLFPGHSCEISSREKTAKASIVGRLIGRRERNPVNNG